METFKYFFNTTPTAGDGRHDVGIIMLSCFLERGNFKHFIRLQYS